MTDRGAAPVRAVIRSFVDPALKGLKVADDDDIFATGVVNSLFAMELILFLERRFGITIETQDLDIENFRSVTRLAELASRKMGGERAATPRTQEAHGADR